jgi:hypothetical protein
MTDLREAMKGTDEEQIQYLSDIFEEYSSYEWGWKHLRGLVSGIRAVAEFSPAVNSFLDELEERAES